jgi:hypothetical protein
MPKMQDLAKKIMALSPAQYEGECEFTYFPVCNEYHWVQTYESLAAIARPVTDDGVALVFGESHFLSLLPLLRDKGIGLLVLADIQPLLHVSNQRLLACFDASATRNEFLEKWHQDKLFFRAHGWRIIQKFHHGHSEDMVAHYHFLYSDHRYNECKKARNTVTVCQMNGDIYDSELSEKIAETVAAAGSTIEFLNVTNIAAYDGDYEMKASVSSLLKYNLNALIAYSKSLPGHQKKLLSQFARGFAEYKAFMDERRKNNFNEVESELDSVIDHLISKTLNYVSSVPLQFIRNDLENFCRLKFNEPAPYTRAFDVTGFFEFFRSLRLSLPENEELCKLCEDLKDTVRVYQNYADIPGTQYHPEKIQYANLVLAKAEPASQHVQALSLVQHKGQAANIQPPSIQQTTAHRQAQFN